MPLVAVGVAFQVTCTPSQIQLVAASFEVVGQALLEAGDDRDDDITFGEYLIQELED